MANDPEWRLLRRRDNALVANLHSCTDPGGMWLICQIEATDLYEDYRPLFEEEERLWKEYNDSLAQHDDPSHAPLPARLDGIHYEMNCELRLHRIRDDMWVSEFIMSIANHKEVHFRFIPED